MNYACFPVGQLQANCWLLWDEENNAILIDPGDDGERLLRILQKRELNLKAILLTHVHFDHMMAVPVLQKATAASLMVHEGDAPALTDGDLSLTVWQGIPCLLTADRLLQEGDTVTVGSMELSVLHTPGHTPGSCCYRCANELFVGDTLFAGSVGRVDFPGGDRLAQRRSLQRLAQLDDTVHVLTGHGEDTLIGREKRTNPYMIGL